MLIVFRMQELSFPSVIAVMFRFWSSAYCWPFTLQPGAGHCIFAHQAGESFHIAKQVGNFLRNNSEEH